MKKKLPKMFKNNINKELNNNKKVFFSANEYYEKEISIDELFKQNMIYCTNTIINLKDGQQLNKTIIGRSIKHLITIDNELIEIDNIKSIRKK